MDSENKTPKVKKQKEPKAVKEKRSTGAKISLIAGITLCAILIPILIANCILIVKGMINKDEPPDLFGYAPAIVLTGSMEPLFDQGDMIFIKKVDDMNEIKKGDVICFVDPGGDGVALLTHRVVTDPVDGKVRTAGDANVQKIQSLAPDKSKYIQVEDKNVDGYKYWTSESDESAYDSKAVTLDSKTIVGKYTYVSVPFVGNISSFMAQPYGWALCIGIPLVAFILFEIFSRKKSDKNKKQDMDALLAELEALKAEKEAANKPVAEEAEADTADAEVADATETVDPPQDPPAEEEVKEEINDSSEENT